MKKTAKQPLSLPPSRPVDMCVGGYRPCFEIGSGGMATVYIARETASTGLCRTVALKLMHEHLRRNERFKKRFLDEARVLTQVNHPYVCRVLGFGEEEGRPFIAMEYLIGEPVSRVLRALKRRVDEVSVAERARLFGRVLADIAEGIHAAHETCDPRGRPLGVVHRDLSPQNLFLLYDGTVRILDFGIARYRDRYVQTAAPGRLIGKLPYMAPEQLQGAAYDRRVDVWALGIVLWELVTLGRLFRRDTELRTMEAVCSDPIPKASEVVEGLPAGLDQILMRALERDPEKRYQTAREMSEDLERWLSRTGEPVTRAALSDFLNGFFPGSQSERRRWAEQATPESGIHYSPAAELASEASEVTESGDDNTPSLTFPKQIPRDDELVTTEHTPTVSYRPPRHARFSFASDPIDPASTRTRPSIAPPVPSLPPLARTSYAPQALPPFTTVTLPPLPSAPLPNLGTSIRSRAAKWTRAITSQWNKPQQDRLSRSSAPETLAAALSLRVEPLDSPASQRLRRTAAVTVPLLMLSCVALVGLRRLNSYDSASLKDHANDSPVAAAAAAPAAVASPAPAEFVAAFAVAPSAAALAQDPVDAPAPALDPASMGVEPETALASEPTADEGAPPAAPPTFIGPPQAAANEAPKLETMKAQPSKETVSSAPNTPEPKAHAPTPPRGSGQVLIMSATPGVSVYLKGRLLGRTPLRVELPAGTTQLSTQANAKTPRSLVSAKVTAGRVNILTVK